MKKIIWILLGFALLLVSCSKNIYTITFYDMNSNAIEEVKVKKGKEIEYIKAPDVEGYEFVGWEINDKVAESNLDIHPIYKEIEYELLLMNGNEEYSREHYRYTDSRENIELPVLHNGIYITCNSSNSDDQLNVNVKYEAKAFLGWSDGVDIYDSTINVDQDYILTSLFDIDDSQTKTHSLVFNLSGGRLSSTFKTEEDYLILNQPTKEDYLFVGWYSNPRFVSSEIKRINLVADNKNYTFYAKYTYDPASVVELIEELPQEITIFDYDQVTNCRAKYALCAVADRSKVTNYDKLTNAEARLSELANIRKLYLKVQSLPELSAVVAADYPDYQQMYNDYYALSNDEKSYIQENGLFSKTTIIQYYNKAKGLYDQFVSEVNQFDLEVLKCPSYAENNCVDKINELYEQYNNFSDNAKGLVKSLDKLTLMKEHVDALGNEYYVTSVDEFDRVYSSKDAFLHGFFTDFYYYIKCYHGTKGLESNGIYSLEDFIACAASTENSFRNIGYYAGEYLLKKDLNGILENQPATGFFGFCYQNGININVINFFTFFFSYWRIDERYANENNYGADIFAESWAPTVDIAKFFYYTSETCYIHTSRMDDCLDNIEGVVYNLDTTPVLRGYTYVRTETSTVNGKVIHKIIWQKDIEQQESDAAALVDVYIHNLTTKVAQRNATTVGYCKDMYYALSDAAKAKVKNTQTLFDYMNQYGL